MIYQAYGFVHFKRSQSVQVSDYEATLQKQEAVWTNIVVYRSPLTMQTNINCSTRLPAVDCGQKIDF